MAVATNSDVETFIGRNLIALMIALPIVLLAVYFSGIGTRLRSIKAGVAGPLKQFSLRRHGKFSEGRFILPPYAEFRTNEGSIKISGVSLNGIAGDRIPFNRVAYAEFKSKDPKLLVVIQKRHGVRPQSNGQTAQFNKLPRVTIDNVNFAHDYEAKCSDPEWLRRVLSTEVCNMIARIPDCSITSWRHGHITVATHTNDHRNVDWDALLDCGQLLQRTMVQTPRYHHAH